MRGADHDHHGADLLIFAALALATLALFLAARLDDRVDRLEGVNRHRSPAAATTTTTTIIPPLVRPAIGFRDKGGQCVRTGPAEAAAIGAHRDPTCPAAP